MPLSFRTLFSLLIACLLLPLAIGCGNKEPISSANSGLQAADEEEPSPQSSDGQPSDSEEADSDAPAESGADSEPGSATDGEPSDGEPQPPTTVPQYDDSILEVPDGDATELAEYVKRIDDELRTMSRNAQIAPPSLEERDAFMKRFEGLIEAQVSAAQKILEDEAANEEQRQLAAKTVFDWIDPLTQMGKEEAAAQARKIAATLADDDDPGIRRLASGLAMDEELQKIRSGDVSDATELLKKMEVVFAGEPDEVSMARFMSSQMAAQEMIQREKLKQAVAIMRVMGEHFVNASQPQLAQAGQDLLDQAKVILLDDGVRKLQADVEGAEDELLATADSLLTGEEADAQAMRFVSMLSQSLEDTHPETYNKLSDKIAAAAKEQIDAADLSADDLFAIYRVANDLGEGHAELAQQAKDAVLANVDAMLDSEEISSDDISPVLSGVVMEAEYAGNMELAASVAEKLSAAVKKIPDEEEREALEMQIEAAQKRANLVGNPITVEGALLNGKEFDWSQYEGKVVLIDFWATWCRPCLAEIPNILENYEKYHDRGFEVIGVNIDQDPATVVEFFARRGELPWPTVVSNDPDAVGPQSAMAEKCGVISIPFVILVDRDGIVQALHVRGPELGERLAEIFPEEAGNAEDAPVDESPVDEVPAEGEPTDEESAPEADAVEEASEATTGEQ